MSHILGLGKGTRGQWECWSRVWWRWKTEGMMSVYLKKTQESCVSVTAKSQKRDGKGTGPHKKEECSVTTRDQ